MTEKQGFIFWIMFWSVFVVIGGGTIVYQSSLMRTYTKVPATIVLTHVDRSYDDEAEQPEAAPRARYEFELQGRTYRNSTIYALPVVFSGNGGLSMAEMIAEQYQPGDRIVAFVDPGDLTRAFIRPTFMPYIFPLFAGTMIFAAILSAVPGRFAATSKIAWTAAIATGALLFGAALTSHYYMISPRPYDTLPAISLLCYAAIWVAVLANSTVLAEDGGWQSAIRSATSLAVVGLYLGLMLWVATLVVSGWLRWVGIEINTASYGAQFMLWTGGGFFVLGVLLGFFGGMRIERSTRRKALSRAASSENSSDGQGSI